MNIVSGLIKIFASAGVDEEDYKSIEAEFYQSNLNNLRFYAAIVFCLFLTLAAANIITGFFNSNNTLIYVLTAASMMIIFLAGMRIKNKGAENTFAIDILVYGFMSVLYLSSIALSLNHPELPAVSYIGILIVLPLLFAARPINIAMHQLVFVVLFCILVNIFKEPFIAGDDTWNVISFYAVSLIATGIVMPMRVKNLYNIHRLAYMSEHDILTGIKNRNAYELYSAQCKTQSVGSTVCVYADVNGLHELNNRKGHAAGDEMLKTVAQNIKDVFGEEDSYRIGGDEFAVFNNAFDEREMREKLNAIRAACEKKGYYVSFGFAGPWDGCNTVCELVKTAESRMYSAKRDFYAEHTEFERRR